MSGLKIKKGDVVKVIAGKDKGKEGKVISALPARNRVIVEKVNIHKKAMRPTQQNPQGGISSIEAPLHVSNVKLVCPSCKQPTRVGYNVKEDGTKVRACKKCGKDID
jgi:large subunit ribosomal protein L24